MQQLGGLKLKDLLTLGNLASGLVAIVAASNNRIAPAFALIVLSLVFDFLDGRVARMSKKDDGFGRELDSIADVVSFGVAPAMVVLSASGSSVLSLVVAIIYLACTAVRLARFNLQSAKGFIGLPSPAAGVVVAACALVLPGAYTTIVVALVASAAMVSSAKLPKF